MLWRKPPLYPCRCERWVERPPFITHSPTSSRTFIFPVGIFAWPTLEQRLPFEKRASLKNRLGRNTLVAVDADVKGRAEGVGLFLEVGCASLDKVNEVKGNFLKLGISSRNTERRRQRLGGQLTSTMPSSCWSIAATGWPITGTVLKRPAFPIRMLRSAWWTRTNCWVVSTCFVQGNRQHVPREKPHKSCPSRHQRQWG